MTRVRIGLVRHFEVSKPMPSGWITSQELAQWREEYDRAEVIPTAVELGELPWNRCLTSDLRRAYLTAEAICAGPIQRMKELREVQTVQLQTGRLRLPFQAWRWLFRLAWMTSHPSQRTAKRDFLARVHGCRSVPVCPSPEEADRKPEARLQNPTPQPGTAGVRVGAPVSDPARGPGPESAPGRRPALRPTRPGGSGGLGPTQRRRIRA